MMPLSLDISVGSVGSAAGRKAPVRRTAMPLTVQEAAGFVAHKLQTELNLERLSTRGRRSTAARELYVKGAADALGITFTHMSRIITGRVRPGMKLASHIARAAKCTVDDVIAISEAYRRAVEEKRKRVMIG